MEFDWSLFFPALAGIGAIATAVATVLKLYVYPWKEQQRKKSQAEKSALEKRKELIQSTIQALELSIEDRVRPNKLSQGANVGWFVVEFEARIKEYHKRFEYCRDWFDACKSVVRLAMMDITKGRFPKTVVEFPLAEALQADPLIDMYVAGENVTLTLISESYPNLHKDILENFKDGRAEHKLGLFFLEINGIFKSNSILRRFRLEKKELIEFAEQLMKDFRVEIEQIDYELSESHDLEYETPEQD